MSGQDLIRRITALKSLADADALLSEYAAQVGDERTARGNMTYFASNVGGLCATNLSFYGLNVNCPTPSRMAK